LPSIRTGSIAQKGKRRPRERAGVVETERNDLSRR
jgi:hypothetical protein